MFETTRHIAIITDRDGVIAVSGSSKKDYSEKRLSPELEKIIESREIYMTNANAKPIRITANEFNPDNYTSQVIAPILAHGDPIGAVMLLSKDKAAKMSDVEEKLIKTASIFLSRQMES